MIKIDQLCMSYGPVLALDGISFEVGKGEVIGLLGPNGAGKSTTLKIVTTYIYPTEGTAYVNGLDVRTNPIEIRKMIGYLPEQLPLYMDMEVSEYLTFVARSRGLSGYKLQSRMEWVKEKCGLAPVFRKLIHQLSKGYKQRTSLAQALIHDPDIVILDEPTSGLDPHQILEIRSLIRELAKEKTIIFSTHILQEVQAITDRIVIINRGKIMADGTIENLQKKMEKQRIELTLSKEGKNDDSKNTNSKIKKCLSDMKGVQNVTIAKEDEKEITYYIEGSLDKDLRYPLAQIVREKNWDFLGLSQKPFTLEEIFLKLTEHDKVAKGA